MTRREVRATEEARLGDELARHGHPHAALEENPSSDEETQARILLAELTRMVRSVPRGLPN